jgi:hypothetical protein
LHHFVVKCLILVFLLVLLEIFVSHRLTSLQINQSTLCESWISVLRRRQLFYWRVRHLQCNVFVNIIQVISRLLLFSQLIICSKHLVYLHLFIQTSFVTAISHILFLFLSQLALVQFFHRPLLILFLEYFLSSNKILELFN